jgi:hypothetical protein
MANGLDAGDSIKGSDTLSFFRGERAALSPGRRDVRMTDLVAYLNDTSVLTNLGGGGANQSQVDSNTFNIGLSSMRLADSDSLVAYDVIDGFCDVFSDGTTGVDQATSTGETYDATDDHFAGSAMVLVSNAFTAQTAPTTAKIVVLYKDISTTAVLNTDCTLEISMDGGSTYSTAFTLEDSGTDIALTAGGGNTVDVLTTNTLTLDSTSGTSIKYRWSNLNAKDQEVHGIYVRWD